MYIMKHDVQCLQLQLQLSYCILWLRLLYESKGQIFKRLYRTKAKVSLRDQQGGRGMESDEVWI